MAMQISSARVQKEDSVQLVKQTLSRQVGVEPSHHLHRFPPRCVKHQAPGGSAVEQNRPAAFYSGFRKPFLKSFT